MQAKNDLHFKRQLTQGIPAIAGVMELSIYTNCLQSEYPSIKQKRQTPNIPNKKNLLADLHRLLGRFSDRRTLDFYYLINQADADYIIQVAEKVIDYYSIEETDRSKLPPHQHYTTAQAKDDIYENTDLFASARYQIAHLLDALAARTPYPRFRMPVDAQGFLKIQIQQCYL